MQFARWHRFFSFLKCSFAACLLLLASCKSTKFVPEGNYLLNKVTVKVDDKNLKKDELKQHVRQKENKRMLGLMKFHLNVYNLSSAKKENDWLKRMGEAPVLYDELQTGKSREQLYIYLKNKGYYNAEVKDSIEISPSKRKLNVVYNIKAGKPYRVRNYMYSANDWRMQQALRSDSASQLLKRNDLFDLDVLNAERQRISTFFRNRGYYNFVEHYVTFQADTNFYNHKVDLTANIGDAFLDVEKTQSVPHQKYKIRNYIINPEFKAFGLADEQQLKLDTLVQNDYHFAYFGKMRYKPVLFYNLNRMKDSTLYCLQNAEKTYRALNRLKQFKLINISFVETNTLSADSVPFLDCRMQLSPLPRQNFSADIEGTNSSGNLGVAGTLNYQHRNVFGGAEVFDVQLRGARERQQALIDNSSFDFNTQEVGVELGLTVPKFLGFMKGKRLFSSQIPETKFSAGFNFQNRPDYTRTITNFKVTYNWQTSQNRYNSFSLFDVNFVSLSRLTPAFINSIKDLYIKSSFTDHLIFASNYSWTYNTQNINKREDYKYFRASIESAGNMLSLLSQLSSKEKVQLTDSITSKASSYYEILRTRFAQYLKGDFEYRYGHIIDKSNSVMGRVFVGVGVPYGNLKVLPFEKKYFTGGANGIRAWQVRSLGPGSYKAPSDVYPNQSSDIKLEANIEYRFKLFWRMEGAIFTDAGNIWAINYRDNREGAVFKIDKFYKQIAVGSGFGLRFDFTYFMFRLDLGMKMRDPSLPSGKRFIPFNYPIKSEHFNLSFAIGYPF